MIGLLFTTECSARVAGRGQSAGSEVRARRAALLRRRRIQRARVRAARVRHAGQGQRRAARAAGQAARRLLLLRAASPAGILLRRPEGSNYLARLASVANNVKYIL